MAYDLHGPWDMRLGHNAPLYEGLADVTPQQKQLNVNSSIQYWLSQGKSNQYLFCKSTSYQINSRIVKFQVLREKN